MRNRWVRITTYVMAAGFAAGCSVGEGSPDGWRYLRTGPVAVAHPKTWRQTPDGAALRGPDGRTDAALTVGPAAGPAPAGVPGSPLTIDGRRARVYGYDRPTADGRPARHVDVHVRDLAGHPVLVRAWAAYGPPDSALLREIVNSIEFH